MDTGLLYKLDAFREALGEGYTVSISPVKGAIGRHAGVSTSMHNFDLTGSVRAIDVFPAYQNTGLTKAQLKRAYKIAVQVGFTGIGVYPDTQPRPMMHLDVRPNRVKGSPSKWSRFAATGKQDHPIERAFV